MNTTLKTIFIANAVFVFAAAMLVPLYALFAEEIGASIVIIGYLAATVFIARIFGMILLRFFEVHLPSSEILLIVGFLLRALAWGLLILAPTIPLLFIVQILIGLGEAVGSPAFLALFAKHVNDSVGLRESIDWELIGAGAGAIGAAVGAYVVTFYGFSVLFVIMSLLATSAAVLFWIIE